LSCYAVSRLQITFWRLGAGGGLNGTDLQPKHLIPRLRQTAR